MEELHAQLLREVQSKNKNYDTIKKMQENSFEIIRRDIEERTSEKCVQGAKLTFLCERQVVTEIFFSVARWKILVAKKCP